MKILHIKNCYLVWAKHTMHVLIKARCQKAYNSDAADIILNRSYTGMYVEWWLHNIGYYLTLPFIKIKFIKKLNERFKHLDLEEHLFKK